MLVPYLIVLSQDDKIKLPLFIDNWINEKLFEAQSVLLYSRVRIVK